MKQLELFDTWEEKNEHLFGNEKWAESLWNKDIWYLQDKWGLPQYDHYNRSIHNGSMLPQKHNICQDGNN